MKPKKPPKRNSSVLANSIAALAAIAAFGSAYYTYQTVKESNRASSAAFAQTGLQTIYAGYAALTSAVQSDPKLSYLLFDGYDKHDPG